MRWLKHFCIQTHDKATDKAERGVREVRKQEFYGDDYRLLGAKFPDIVIQKTGIGTHVFINGNEIPGLFDYSVNPEHPFPKITLVVGMNSIAYDDNSAP